MKIGRFDHKTIDNKWQEKWRESGIYEADIADNNKFYNLWMFPYPSAEGLHAGHAYASTGSDIFGRYTRMRGKNVLQPIGYDSFGIHSENFAMKIGQSPQEMLARTTKNYERQLRSLGHGYDWSRTVTTSDADYYRWTQWLFVKLFEVGLAYKKEAEVNWCPSCMTVLADEQVVDDKCERCQSIVGKKKLLQWFLRITKYADRLLSNLDKIDWPEKIKAVQRNWIGKKGKNYHLRDWLISRQRYWGCPIPMIECSKCGWVPVPEDELPVKLPDITDFKPDGTGRGPLAKHKEFYETKCPKCDGEARRETDVADTFLDSSWYFLRYPSTSSGQVPFDSEVTGRWLPVDLYFGGAEHSVLHLMYARFVTMVLYDLKLIGFEEPFPRFFAHGLMIKDGAKMSKSRGNVINPDQYIEKYGADAFRLYLMFIGPMDGSPDFRDTGMEGMARFVNRLWKLDGSGVIQIDINKLVSEVTEDVERFRYNTAIAKIMSFVNTVEKEGLNLEQAKIFWKLMAPFVPHLAEEMWEKLGGEFSIHRQSWPEYEKVEEQPNLMVVQVNGRIRDRIGYFDNEKDAIQEALKSEKVQVYIEGRQYKTIFVSGKLVNFVV